jgi:hypothetical protein
MIDEVMPKKCALAIAVLMLPALNCEIRAAALPIDTDVIKRSVVFLVYPDGTGGATGFVVGIPLKSDPTQMHVAIITARHVLDPEWAGCPGNNPQSIELRINKKNYRPEQDQNGVYQASITLVVNGMKTWASHPDDKVDVALIPIGEPGKLFENDVITFSLNEFGTKEEIDKFKIGIGDGIISAGLVPQLFDIRRNYPAFKFGRISNVMTEPYRMRCRANSPPKERWEWIVAGNFVGGNSGSPVFLLPLDFSVGPPFQYNGPRPMLIGLLSGSIEGADLGVMVPVEFIFDVVQRAYPDADLYRGDLKDKPKRTP